MAPAIPTTTLYRPVGQAELDLIAASGHRRFPPRLPEQPIFYPVCNEEYAVQIASRWNTAEGKVGYVTRFAVRSDFLQKYDVHIVGSRIHAEYWIPAEDLETFNDAIVGTIEVIGEHQAEGHGTKKDDGAMSIAHLADTGLPFNRKERFFTGTVLPMLVCADNFAHFGRLTELVGLDRIDVDACPGSANVQFFTEYSFVESVVGEAKARFPGAPTRKDTPDVLIYVAGPRRALIAIEAKMYDRPTTAGLNDQLGAQAALVRYIAGRLDVDAASIAHVALLPAALASELGKLVVATVTWERLLETYADVAPPYFFEVLRVALARYDQLVSTRPTWGANAETKLTGAEIYERHGAGSIATPWMGRQGGLNGAELTKDIASGTWCGQLYECSSKPVQNKNWFTVAEFVARIGAP